MDDRFIRTEMIFGQDAMDQLRSKHIAIFGIGGVGGYVVEALVRSGVEHITIIDNDVVSISNINRQIIATEDTIGQPKVEVMKKRILSINKNVEVNDKQMFVTSDNIKELDFKSFDYIVDAIDTVKSKIELVKIAYELDIPIISSMGTGNKINPMGFAVSDINKTEMDPLAKVMRRELRNIGIKKLKVVYSKEEPIKPNIDIEENGRHIPGSNAFVPAAAGLLIASEVIKDLTKNN